MRARVLVVAEAVTLAHAARASVLARTLDPTRYDVSLAWDPRYNEVLGPLTFPFHPIRSMPTATFLRRLSSGAPMHDTGTLRGYVQDELRVIERVAPDLIVSDFRFSLAASARLAGVPLVAVANAYWSPYARQTFLFREYDYPLTRVLSAPVARGLFRALRPLGFAAHTRPLNRVLHEHGLPGIGHDIRVMYTCGDYTVYTDTPLLIPTFGRPPNHEYVGAVVWSPHVAPPEWWGDLPHDRPIVYATPGTSGHGDLLQIVLDALADLPVTIVAATAGQDRLHRVPGNARIAAFLPGLEAARRSALVICNGGSATSVQALAAGVPVLGIPGANMDQHLNSEAVRRAGAGELIGARRATPARIRALAERMLDAPTYRRAAAALAQAHREHDVATRFPVVIEAVLRNRRAAR